MALQALDATLLARHQCWFGGGTAISLLHGEFRESVDIDFMCASIAGFRELRSVVRSLGLQGLMRAALGVVREPRIDQYGIRSALEVDGKAIKFEIVLEGRIPFDDPAPGDVVCGVATLSHVDLVASKLLANSDRWADDAVMSRDLIDLSALCSDGRLPVGAVQKAETAYGDSIRVDLRKAVSHLLDRPGRLARCIQAMAVTTPEPELRARIAALPLMDTEPPAPLSAGYNQP